MANPVDNGTNRRLVLLVTTIAPFIFAFMSQYVNIALPSIAQQGELSLDAVMQLWLVTSFILTSAALLVPFGRIADIYGRKKIFTWGIAIFTLSSFLAGISNSATMLISCRVLQGIGGAMTIATATALLITAFPANERGKVLGINVAAMYIGLSLGPVLGGVMTYHLGWRSIFFMSAFLGLADLIIVIWKMKGEWTGAKGEKFDYVGSIIYVIGLIALVYGFSTLEEAMWLGAALIGGGIIGLGVFVWWETKTRNPVLDMSLFRNNKTFTFSNLSALVNYSATFAVFLLISLYLQYLKGFDPQYAGLILVALPVMQAIFSAPAGRLSDRIEPRVLASAGIALTTVGLIVFIFLNAETPLPLIIGNLTLMGIGLAFFASPNYNAVMSSAPRTAYGIASATLGTMRQVGMVLSMGIATLMSALYIGRAQITPEYYPLFQKSMQVSFIIFAVLCFGGIFASLARGKLR